MLKWGKCERRKKLLENALIERLNYYVSAFFTWLCSDLLQLVLHWQGFSIFYVQMRSETRIYYVNKTFWTVMHYGSELDYFFLIFFIYLNGREEEFDLFVVNQNPFILLGWEASYGDSINKCKKSLQLRMFVEFDFSIFNYREHFKKSKVFFGLMNSINGKFEYLSNFREKNLIDSMSFTSMENFI